jgi:hypothetical protein
VAHQLPRDPVHLFDANIFYPAKHTLAFSEHLFTLAMMGAPLAWGGGGRGGGAPPPPPPPPGPPGGGAAVATQLKHNPVERSCIPPPTRPSSRVRAQKADLPTRGR